MPEMIFIFLLALLLFGPKKLPQVGRELGKALNEFKRASNDFKNQLEVEIEQAEVLDREKTTAAEEGQRQSTAEGAPLQAEAALAQTEEPRILPPSEPVVANTFGQTPSPETPANALAAHNDDNGNHASPEVAAAENAPVQPPIMSASPSERPAVRESNA